MVVRASASVSIDLSVSVGCEYECECMCKCEGDFARDRMCKCNGGNKIAKEKKRCVEGFSTVMSTMNV